MSTESAVCGLTSAAWPSSARTTIRAVASTATAGPSAPARTRAPGLRGRLRLVRRNQTAAATSATIRPSRASHRAPQRVSSSRSGLVAVPGHQHDGLQRQRREAEGDGDRPARRREGEHAPAHRGRRAAEDEKSHKQAADQAGDEREVEPPPDDRQGSRLVPRRDHRHGRARRTGADRDDPAARVAVGPGGRPDRAVRPGLTRGSETTSVAGRARSTRTRTAGTSRPFNRARARRCGPPRAAR